MNAVARSQRGAAGVRFALVFVVVAAVLAVVFFVGDAYAHGRVEREAATQLQSQLGTPTAPDVTIIGKPFLTQVAARHLRAVSVVADDVGQGSGSTLPVAHLDMTFYDVTTTDWWKTMTAGRAEGYALIDHDALKAAAGVPLTYVGSGRYELKATQSLYGATVSATVSGGLALDEQDQTVSLSNPKIEVAGYPLPDAVADQLIKAIVKPIPLEGIPLGLQASSLAVQDDGLHVGLKGEDIPLTR